MATELVLRNYTDEFFKHYWSPSLGSCPEWAISHWYFNSEIPNHKLRGCYALFVNDVVVYVGVGIGNSSGKYIGSGLGDRLKRYYETNKDNKQTRKYTAKGEWLDRGVTSILTIGFPEQHYHIAAGLEIYLIERLQPKYNMKHNITTTKKK